MNYTIKSTTEQIENIGRLVLAREIFKNIGLIRVSATKTKNAEILRSMLGLPVQGRTSYEEIEIYKHSNLFKTALELQYVPAKEKVIYEKKVKSSEQFHLELKTA